MLQDLFAAGHDKIRVSSAAAYLPQTSDGGKEHMKFLEARSFRNVNCFVSKSGVLGACIQTRACRPCKLPQT